MAGKEREELLIFVHSPAPWPVSCYTEVYLTPLILKPLAANPHHPSSCISIFLSSALLAKSVLGVYPLVAIEFLTYTIVYILLCTYDSEILSPVWICLLKTRVAKSLALISGPFRSFLFQ